MFKIATLNKISDEGLFYLKTPDYEITDELNGADAVLVRSASMHEIEFDDKLLSIARAGAGVNNIPLDKCSDKGIVVFNTPGANANAVKELVVAALLFSSRDIFGGMEWVKTLKEDVAKQVEKGKSQFAGNEIEGKTLGVIGLGAIGNMVANEAIKLGMDVIGYDPYISIDAAWKLSKHVRKATTLKEIYENSDYITIHVPYMESTKNTIDAEGISQMKDGVKLLNFARNGLIDEEAVKEALNSGKIAKYITDFPHDDIANVEGVIALPHLGASTHESEENCAKMAARQTKEYLENGNIVNSVNYPTISMPRGEGKRVLIFHKNVPSMVSQITNEFSKLSMNIENMINKSNKNVACTMIDVIGEVKSEMVDDFMKIDGVVRVRIID